MKTAKEMYDYTNLRIIDINKEDQEIADKVYPTFLLTVKQLIEEHSNLGLFCFILNFNNFQHIDGFFISNSRRVLIIKKLNIDLKFLGYDVSSYSAHIEIGWFK